MSLGFRVKVWGLGFKISGFTNGNHQTNALEALPLPFFFHKIIMGTQNYRP